MRLLFVAELSGISRRQELHGWLWIGSRARILSGLHLVGVAACRAEADIIKSNNMYKLCFMRGKDSNKCANLGNVPIKENS